MKCPNCQNNLPDGAVFCNVCGGSIMPHPLVAEAAGQGFTPPDGFTLDPGSGLYYITTPGQNPETGEDGQWTTWFYPDSGEYVQQFHPAAPVADSAPLRSQAVPKKKGRISPLLVALPIAVLIIGVSIAFVVRGGMDLFRRNDPGIVIPEQVVTPPTVITPVAPESPESSGSDTQETPSIQAPESNPTPTPTPSPSPSPQPEIVDGVRMGTFKKPGYNEYLTLNADKTYTAYGDFGSGWQTVTGTWDFSEHEDMGYRFVNLYRPNGEWLAFMYIFPDDSGKLSPEDGPFGSILPYEVMTNDGNGPPPAVQQAALITLNMDLFHMIGKTNGELKARNGDICYAELAFGGTPIAGYTAEIYSEYPVTFWLESGYEDALDVINREGGYGYRNFWPDDYIITGISVWEDGNFTNMHYLFINDIDVPLNYDNIAASFRQAGAMVHVPANSEMMDARDIDFWDASFYIDESGEYVLSVIFIEAGGDMVADSAWVYRVASDYTPG